MGSKKKTGRNKVQKMASNSSVPACNLLKKDLGGVIFGCKGHTIQECFSKKLFGLPAPHFAYVKKVTPGLPLFLFNYSNRKLHGIFEAASHGQLNIDPHAWTGGNVECTEYPAQVKFSIRKMCYALTEDQFSPIIADNYYEMRLFYFELTQPQTDKLIKMFSSSSVPCVGLQPRNIPASEASTSVPQSNPHVPFGQNTWSSLFNNDSTSDMVNKDENVEIPQSNAHVPFVHNTWSSLFKDDSTSDIVNNVEKFKSSHPTFPLSKQSNEEWEWESHTSHLINKSEDLHKVCAEKHAEASTSIRQSSAHVPFEHKRWSSLLKDYSISDTVNNVENLKVVSSHPTFPLPKQSNEEWEWESESQTSQHLINKSGELQSVCAEERAEGDNTQPLLETLGCSLGGDSSAVQCHIQPEFSDILSTVAKLVQSVTVLVERQKEKDEKIRTLEKELVQSRDEYQELQNRYNVLQAGTLPSSQQFEGIDCEPLKCNLKTDNYAFVVGGFDGSNSLCAMNSYSPLNDQMGSLTPMTFLRTYYSVANLNGEVYVLGGVCGDKLYDTVEAYDPKTNQWRPRPSLNQKKQSLAAASLNDKIFAVGGGNGVEYFSEVEMLDLNIGKWIHSRSMLEKRIATAAVDMKGAVYVVGGYDGRDYLKSAERFDPREHTWRRLGNMKSKRANLSLVAYNEKLYALGGYDGSTMVPSVEVFDPRVDSWIVGEEMNNSRGNFGAVVIGGILYAFGGMNDNEEILSTVECYGDGYGWELTNLKGIGQRCLFSAIVL